jgi:hypothetical protein
MENVKKWQFQKSDETSPTTVAQIIYKFRLEDKQSRRRTTRFIFELPNVVSVTSQYMPLMP